MVLLVAAIALVPTIRLILAVRVVELGSVPMLEIQTHIDSSHVLIAEKLVDVVLGWKFSFGLEPASRPYNIR